MPSRVLDTRGGAKVGSADGTGAPLTLSLFGRGGLPAGGIDAVALNVTVVDGENPTPGNGYVTVYPCGTRPDASNLNFTTGQTIPNSVLAPVSQPATVCFYVYGTAHLLADVSGYIPSGSQFTSLVPTPGVGHPRRCQGRQCQRHRRTSDAVAVRSWGSAQR